VRQRARHFYKRHPKLTSLVVLGLAVVVVAAVFAVWESGRECVRWSTRITVTKTGAVTTTRVCAETRPRWGENVGK
jgi:hypothetical protein